MKKRCYRFLYNLLSRISVYWNNRRINKYKIICGMGLLTLSGACRFTANTNSGETKKEDATPERNPEDDENIFCYITVEEEIIIESDTIPEEVLPPPPPPPLEIIEIPNCYITEITCYEPIECYVPVIECDEPEDEPDFYRVAEVMPQFPGGDHALIDYLQETPVYPEKMLKDSIQGRVICQFIIDEEGVIRDVEVVRSIDPELDDEAVRVINNMPRWIPGRQRGKAVKVQYTIPVMFRLPEENPEP